MSRTKTTVKVEKRTLEVSNLEKVFYPETGFTKGQMLDFYIKIAPVLLPHLKGRALTMKRYPDGAHGMFFYEKQKPEHAPSWIKSTRVQKSDGVIDYCMINDLPSLVWVANIANLEFHVFTHLAKAETRPTSLMFDLDPGPPASILECAEVAFWIKDLFKSLKMETFVKTSGSKGLQLVVPLNTATHYDKTKAFAKAMAQWLASKEPSKVVSLMKKTLRKGKIFIDWSQNDDKKTTVCVYSLRAKEQPSVSTPITWQELKKAVKAGDKDQLYFTPEQVLQRVKKKGDLFEEVLTLKQKLPALSKVPELEEFSDD